MDNHKWRKVTYGEDFQLHGLELPRDGVWCDWMDKNGNVERARFKYDVISHFYPHTDIVKEEMIAAWSPPILRWPKITLDTPIEDLQKIHKDIWEYVIKYHEKPYTPYRSHCAACEYAYLLWAQEVGQDLGAKMCSFCPIQWPEDRGCRDSFSLYLKYQACIWRSIDFRKRETSYPIADFRLEGAAMEIRDVPFKMKNGGLL